MPTSDAFQPLYPVMEKYGVTCSPAEFHEAVNLAFHKAESQVYDQIHQCMWESLPQQVDLLASDAIAADGAPGPGLLALDIGCGTGLASELLLKSSLGARISEIDLLDTSKEMLEQIKDRAGKWRVKSNRINGDLARVAGGDRRYNVIITCSVLHHIPDLPQFLKQVRSIMAPGAVFMHLQDPNGDYQDDSELKVRIADYKQHQFQLPSWLRRLSPGRVAAKIRRELGGEEDDSYLNKVNEELTASGVILSPMSPQDIWRVTDIHVHDGEGISIKHMTGLLADCQLISHRSYSFFGKMLTELPADYQRKENDLTNQHALNGMHVAAAWKAPGKA